MSVKLEHTEECLEQGQMKESADQVQAPRPANYDEDEEYSHREQRKIIHKIDRRLVTVLGLLFAVCIIDRNNVASANIAGMSQDLQLTIGNRYSIIVLVFFAPYVAFQLPSSVVVRKIGPRTFLPGITLLWGIVMICFGFAKNWTVLIGLRFIMGILEAGLFPGAVYLLSMWYSRYDVHKRYSSFYLISSVGGAFSGILGFAFMQMGGLGNMAAWSWIFIMEGILSCLIAVVGYIFLVDFPQGAHKSWRFLTEKEAAYVIRRIQRDRGDHTSPTEDHFTMGKLLRPALDLKVWAFAVIMTCSTAVAYSIVYFLPLILQHQLGYSVGVAQLLTTPPYFWAGICMYAEGWVGDRFHIRSPILVFNSLMAIVGLALLGWTSVSGVQYFGIFLITAGCQSNIPAVMAWQANNIRGTWKRAFTSASLIGFGGIGGITGALVFRSQDAPKYLPGLYACFACNALTIILSAILVLYFMDCNRKVKNGSKVIEGLPGFDYTL